MKHVLVYGMTDNPGGIETYLLNFFQRVQGNDIMLDFVSDFPAICGSEVLRKRGANLYFIPAKSKDLWGHLKGMWQILNQHKEYEAVYFNILDAGAAITMLPVFLLRRKIVVHSHNNDTDKARLHKLMKPLLNFMTKGRAACSESAAVYMFGERCGDCLVIPNAIDAKHYAYCEAMRQAKRKELGIQKHLVVCHVGRISMQKNPLRLIDIFEAVHQKCPEAILLSVGNGEMMDEYRAYIEQKGLKDAVMCLGVRKDIAEILQAADVFLFPSLYEGLGIAVLEAQAAGLPCVISDVIPRQASVTDLVQAVSLDTPAEQWAECVLEQAKMPRKNTFSDLVKAGFDVSCCVDFDKKLLELF